MNVAVIKTNLKDGIVLVERATGENPNLPILKHILFEADNGKLKLTATNLEIAVSSYVNGKVITRGKLAVPGGVLSNIISNLPGERVNLEGKGVDLEIKTDNYSGVLCGLNTDEFPLIPKLKNKNEYIEIEGGVFKDALSQVISAAQYSDMRPELSCVLLRYNLETLVFAATDSFRLAEKTVSGNQFTSHAKKEFSILIPLKTAQEALRIVRNEDLLQLYTEENQVLFSTNTTECISRLNEGVFPDYHPIIPKKHTNEIYIKKTDLINGLKTIGALGNKNNEIRMRSLNEKSVEIYSAGETLGQGSYIIPAKTNGAIKDIIFNWRFFLDGLKSLKTEEVFIGVNSDKPTLIRDEKNETYFYVLAPIINP